MELVELSNKFLAELMFEKLDLPKPVYFTYRLEQGGYVSAVEFYGLPNKRGSLRRVALPSPISKDGVTSMSRAVAQART